MKSEKLRLILPKRTAEMKIDEITSCYIGPEISPEQFVPEHFFVFLCKGKMHGYDGGIYSQLNAGEACVVRKNRLARYNKDRQNDEFERVIVVLDEAFLKSYISKRAVDIGETDTDAVFLPLGEQPAITAFVSSLMPLSEGNNAPEQRLVDEKREELVDILLAHQPDLAGILFDFSRPDKINLEEFMCRNYRFNVSIQRFAFLTGRSVSGFKRDFRNIFDQSPAKWLIQRRLREAYFLILKKQQKPSQIYLDLGFEDLSHFSYAFKKYFGLKPSKLTAGMNLF